MVLFYCRKTMKNAAMVQILVEYFDMAAVVEYGYQTNVRSTGERTL